MEDITLYYGSTRGEAHGGAPPRADGEARRERRASERLPTITAEEAFEGLQTSPGECADDACRAGPDAPCASQPVVGMIMEYVRALPPRDGSRKKPAPTALQPEAPTAEAAAVRTAAAALGCDTESCVLAHPSLQKFAAKHGMSPRAIAGDLAARFKPVGPRDTTALLSNFDIDGVLKRWARQFSYFYHIPFAMMDLDSWELGRANLGSIFARRGVSCVGCVVNTDTSRGPGKHWVSVFVDARPQTWTVEYFNSAGNPPPKPMAIWMEKARAQLAAARETGEVETVAVTDVDHQESQTECGIYALYFIRRRLEGTPYDFFCDRIVPDAAMTAFRAHLFRK